MLHDTQELSVQDNMHFLYCKWWRMIENVKYLLCFLLFSKHFMQTKHIRFSIKLFMFNSLMNVYFCHWTYINIYQAHALQLKHNFICPPNKIRQFGDCTNFHSFFQQQVNSSWSTSVPLLWQSSTINHNSFYIPSFPLQQRTLWRHNCYRMALSKWVTK